MQNVPQAFRQETLQVYVKAEAERMWGVRGKIEEIKLAVLDGMTGWWAWEDPQVSVLTASGVKSYEKYGKGSGLGPGLLLMVSSTHLSNVRPLSTIRSGLIHGRHLAKVDGHPQLSQYRAGLIALQGLAYNSGLN